jgi:anti-anti-sigma regulatory factor
MEPEEIVPGLYLERTPEGDVTVISMVGEVAPGDIGGALEFGARLALNPPKLLVLDFSRATRLKSLGVGLLGHYREFLAARGGRMALVSPPEEILAGLAPLDLRRLFEVCDTREGALAAVRGGEEGAPSRGSADPEA